MSAHTCHAIGCAERCPPKRLFCLRHWRMVPGVVQDAVWAAYRPGQERRGLPSDEWFQAARAAQVVVADLERRDDVPPGYRKRGAAVLERLESYTAEGVLA